MLSDHMKEYVQQLLDQSLMLMESPETIDEAIEKLKLVLKVEPTNAEANYTLAKVYLTKEKYSDALHHLELIKGEEYTEKDIYSEIKKTRQIIKEKDIESEVITNHTDIRKHKKIISFIPIKKPDIRNLFSQINTGENRIHILSNLILIVACYLLLRSSLHDGYPQSHLDATVAFYIAKIKMIILNRSLYTPSWYFGYELLKFYPPLSTIIPAILALLAGNVQYSYYIICFILYTAFCIGVYYLAASMYTSKLAGFATAFLWVFNHVNFISFQGHYWETCRLIGTAAVPWVLYFLQRTINKGNKKYLIASIFLSSFAFLSNLFSAIDLALLVGPYLLITVTRSKIIHGNNDLDRIYRGWRVIILYTLGLLALTLWWYIPAVIPHGLSAFLTGNVKFTPTLYEIFLQNSPPSYMPAVQLPITFLGLVGILIGMKKRSNEWFILLSWLASSYVMAYVVKVQSSRVVLLFGLILVFGFGYLIKATQEYIKTKDLHENMTPALTISTLAILGLLFLQYLPSYRHFPTVNEDYLTSDEYVTATWLSENTGTDYRAYLMWGRWYRGSQWVNAFYPEVLQVLGGYDQGARVTSDLPFIIDELVKWREEPSELQRIAREHNIKYIVIDKRFMELQVQGYDKFTNPDYFTSIDEINSKLNHASVYEVKGISPIDPTEAATTAYSYWNSWKIIGVLLSIVFLVVFRFAINRVKLVETVH